MKKTFTREMYIPKNYSLHSEITGKYAAYIDSTTFQHTVAMFFIGKRSKPAWHYRFANLEAAEKSIANAISRTEGWEKIRAERKIKNQAISPEGKIQIGDIFYDSWGYNMTNIDFYKIKRLTPKGAEVIGLGQIETADGYLCGTTIPSEKELTANGILKVKNASWNEKGSVYLTGTIKNIFGLDDKNTRKTSLTKWDGRPKYFNHCD